MTPRLARRAGFTLVEVLVVLLIMAGMMMAMLQILNAARTSRDTVHNIQETQLAGPAILDLVERDLRAIYCYGRPKDALLRVKNRVVYGLDADSLDFVCSTQSLTPVLINAQDRYVRADYNEVGYVLRPSPADDNFLELYRRESLGVDEEPFDEGSYTFLHERVKHFDVKVFDEDGPDAEPLETWNTVQGDEHTGLPKRLEIELTLELAPRIMREQLEIAPIDKRTMTYKRTIRFPDYLLDAVVAEVRPKIPVINPPTGDTDGAAPSTGGDPGSASGDPSGPTTATQGAGSR
ncbi:MAG: prepilin-type N-terminal cleavage/methylation domain-containing protein [Planctomycetes bacterium]|nr:prepilin-type N-terminal cleavage/methylation domain-containing protein [Planctomycetota bacterium]